MDGVADAGDGAVAVDGDLLGTRGGEAGGVAAAKVVDEDGVVPVGLDGGVAIVGALRLINYNSVTTSTWGWFVLTTERERPNSLRSMGPFTPALKSEAWSSSSQSS